MTNRSNSSTSTQNGRDSHAPTPLLTAYVRSVVVIGAAAIVCSVPALFGMAHPLAWMLFMILALLAGTFSMKASSISMNISVNDTFFIASAMLFGAGPATLIVALNTFVTSYRRRHDWAHVGFNTGAVSFSMWVGAHVFFRLASVSPLAQGVPPVVALIVPLLCLTGVYFSLNTGLTAAAIALDCRDSIVTVWNRHFRWLLVNYLAAASVSFCLILLFQVSLAATAMVVPLVIIFHMTLRSSFGRLDDTKAHLANMDRLYLSTVETLAMAIDAKDDVTHGHVRRVQAYALGLARAMGINDEPSLKAIEAAALLHDTGKLAVPEHILNKPGRLTEAEFETMKRHVDVGANILSLVDFPYPVVPIVRCHHEYWDGSGYPNGIKGTAIPIGARILSVVDCYDAVTSDRPYRPALTTEAALEILRERAGGMYDPEVVETFIRIQKTIPIGDITATPHHDVIHQINETHQAAAASAVPATAPAARSDEMLAFVSLARIASGEVGVADVLALSSNLIRDIVPGVTAAWYILDLASDRIVVADAVGPAADGIRGTSIRVGDRLTGWVAANRQVIVNSDPTLDLGSRAAELSLRSCLSVPLLSGETLVGALTLYGGEPNAFSDDQGRLVQMLAPQVAQAIARAQQSVFAAVPTHTHEKPSQSAHNLRLVSNG